MSTQKLTHRIIRQSRPYAALAAAGATTALLALAAPTPAQATGLHLVLPGQSIQQAIDRSAPGDTILVTPGTYRGSLRISVPGLTLRGMGATTVIAPQDDPVTGSAADCAAAGHGICVTGTADKPVPDVTIESLAVSGFVHNGIWGSGTDRLTVRRVLAEQNGQEGIGEEKSVRGRFTDNTSRDNGEAGIFLANIADGKGGATDTQGTLIARNDLTGNRMGLVVRRLRDLTVEHNTMSSNCAGVFLVGDDDRPRTGDLDVRDNQVTGNNSYCPATDKLPYLQGIGIVLTGVEQTRVTHNQVTGNTGAAPMSGGIVLFKSFNGGPSMDNTISDNIVTGNGPADLADRDTGTNTFTGNQCQTSEPAGRC
ncbi:right-handed parallel beta-helix repeat-containing protein [Actinacidiphila acididurans]|uniref:Right-handed parallel beta-helix repeat-containing protein n=1 Tax=Actinacidiphila acididurans TaxID=2784346 RepID=A0ABS2U307_9ACTN|nr:right-handed parallel beta-helix repeat-containing protein [Actinacidiphila acididurans]MBM9508538.1 right-handed parallel beta-helix repeat-containing protein [Actinacidiphila acididurans]